MSETISIDDFESLREDLRGSGSENIPNVKHHDTTCFIRGKKIADQAVRIINGERQNIYGNPEDTFATIAAYWSTYLGISIDSADVALMMSLFKIAREQHGKGCHQDNLVDLVGYSLLYGDKVGYNK